MSLNKACILGVVGRDPETRTFQNGGKVCNLSVATSEKWRDKNTGQRQERTEWHRVAIFNDKIAEVAEKYLRKGSKVYIEGQIETRKWTDQNGAERETKEIVLRPFRGMLDLIDGGRRDDGDAHEPEDRGGGAMPGSVAGELNDEVPFAPAF